ncbi:MAG: hypothetical protein V9G19_22035 [Tetrasphaera sp.]
MGYSTSYLGRLDVRPRLNPEEVEWLRAFRRTQRAFHPDDPYAVPMNPSAEHESSAIATKHTGGGWSWPSRGASGVGRCDWEPCVGGRCLHWSDIEKSNSAVYELTYLINHFLRPGAFASTDGRADFAAFTFDHRVDGTIAALRGDTRELFLIVASDNVVTTRTLVAGDVLPWG